MNKDIDIINIAAKKWLSWCKMSGLQLSSRVPFALFLVIKEFHPEMITLRQLEIKLDSLYAEDITKTLIDKLFYYEIR